MENLIYYNKFRSVPQDALKEIQAGRLKGMSDINPMWRIKALTEVFGVCGVGWKYVITEQKLEKGCLEQISSFVSINLFIKVNNEWSDAIPGIGGASFVSNERNGLYQSDECFKMALTDALGIACKALGMAADVYYSKDRTKYNTVNENPLQKLEQKFSETYLKVSEHLKNCTSLEDITILWDSLENDEQKECKALFTKRRLEIENSIK